jgi:hypothetical protein
MSLLPLFFGEVPEPFTAPDPVPMSTYWRIEVALTTAPYAVSQTYTDITTQVRSLSLTQQRGGPNDPVVPQTADIEVDNRDGRWNASSTYASAPYANNVVPDRRVRLSVRESDAASFVVLATLHLESVETADGPFDAIAVLRCSDLFRILAQSQPVAISRPVELPGQRVTALLNAAGVPAGLRSTIDNGTVTLGAADLSGQVLGLLHEINRCEQGMFRVDTLGRVEFRDRYHWLDTTALNSSQATIDEAEFLYGDVTGVSGSFVTPRSVAASGDTGNVKSYTSINLPTNFPATFGQELGVPLLYDADVEVLAELVQKQSETVQADESRPDGVRMWVATPSAVNAPILADVVDAGTLPVEHLFYVSLTYRPIGWSSDRDAQCRVESVRHDVTAESWELTYGFSAVDSRWRSEAPNHFYQFGTAITADHRGSL